MERGCRQSQMKLVGADFTRAYLMKGVFFMAIILRLDRVMADRKMSLNELSERVGVSNVNLSKIKTGKISAVRFSTLNAICQP